VAASEKRRRSVDSKRKVPRVSRRRAYIEIGLTQEKTWGWQEKKKAFDSVQREGQDPLDGSNRKTGG